MDAHAPALPRLRPRAWQVWLAAAFSLGSLILALRDVDLRKVTAAFYHVEGGWLALAAVSVVVTLVAKAARWRLLFALRRPPSLGLALSAQSLGMLVNAAIPVRLGDLARAYLIGEAEADSKVYALGTIAVEKVTDLFFLALALVLLVSQMALPAWLPVRETAVIVAAAVVLVVVVDRQNDLILRSLHWAARFVPSRLGEWLQRQARLGLASLQVVRRPRLFVGLLAWSLFIWFLSALTNYLVFLAMGLSPSPWAALLLLVVLQAGVAVPSSPGRLGVFHYLAIISLSLFAVDKEIALGYGVVLHLVVYAPMAVLGAYYLWREKVTWQKLEEAAARVERLIGGTP
ncbi:MAG: flippase-like domain-containing protein [Chloroflexi bacterium]|nr:flippase-like domain-containing protein [Chloroflexota bacterium]